MKASKLNDEESAEKLMAEFGEEVEEKLRLGLSKEDLFFIHNEYFEVNPIFKYYEKVLRCAYIAQSGYISIDAVSMSEDDCSEVAFYFIMKFIDKILGMKPKAEKKLFILH